LLKRRINLKFLFASLKTLIYSLIPKIVPKAAANFCSGFLVSQWSISSSIQYSWLGAWDNFQDQRRLSEQLLESQAAIGKSEQGYLLEQCYSAKDSQKL
jgi:hypothetical protein